MVKIYTSLFLAFTVSLLAINCKKKSTTTDACAGVTVNVVATKTDASQGLANGSITITSPTGTGVTYSLNNAAAVSTSQFSNLAAGAYTIKATTANGCTGTTTVTIAAADPCLGKNIVVSAGTIVGNTPCGTSADGSITINATGGTGFQYKIGTGAYQTGNVFTGLTAGSYTLFAKDVDGCEKTASATVTDKPAGTFFTQVRSIINSKCVSCHGATAPSGGVSLNTDCSIVQRWDRIKARCVDGTPSFMPTAPNPQLSTTEKASITNWVNAGHRFID
jgi:hypothetical protein